MVKLKSRLKNLKRKIRPYLTPKMIVSFGIAWYITNGHAYTLLGLGIWLDIAWMKIYGGAYLAILFLPITPEKLITIPLSFLVHRILFGKVIKKEDLEVQELED